MSGSVTSAAQLTALTNAIQTLVAAIGVLPTATATTRTPIHDLYSSTVAFDLSTRAGVEALKEMSAPLDTTWDGTVSDFPGFTIALRLRAIQCNWNAPY